MPSILQWKSGPIREVASLEKGDYWIIEMCFAKLYYMIKGGVGLGCLMPLSSSTPRHELGSKY
jgi:hypothetical protein